MDRKYRVALLGARWSHRLHDSVDWTRKQLVVQQYVEGAWHSYNRGDLNMCTGDPFRSRHIGRTRQQLENKQRIKLYACKRESPQNRICSVMFCSC